MTSDQERIAFEKKHCRQFLMDWSSDHQTYWSMPTRMLWQGWQARAAMHIEADRQARGEPVAWHSKQYGVVWMAIKPGNLVAGTQWFIQGRQEPVAEVMSPVSLVWHVATSELEHGTVFYTTTQPQQIPEGWKEAAIAWEVCASIHRSYCKGKDPLYSTRQADFVKHAKDARAMLAAAPEPKEKP